MGSVDASITCPRIRGGPGGPERNLQQEGLRYDFTCYYHIVPSALNILYSDVEFNQHIWIHQDAQQIQTFEAGRLADIGLSLPVDVSAAG